MFGNTERVVLHARAAANISQHQDLGCYMSLCGWAIPCWEEQKRGEEESESYGPDQRQQDHLDLHLYQETQRGK